MRGETRQLSKRFGPLASALQTLALEPRRGALAALAYHRDSLEGRRSRQTIVRSDSSRFLAPVPARHAAQVGF